MQRNADGDLIIDVPKQVTVPMDNPTPVRPFQESHPTSQFTLPVGSKLIIPDKHPYLISSDTKRVLATVDKMTAKGRNPNLLVSGPQGTGKSELPTQYAATRQLPYAVVEIGLTSDPAQMFGYLDLKDGNTTYVKALFTEALTTEGCVIHLQEINRPENDKSLNALFSVLDDNQRVIWIDELQDYLHVAPGVVFFATMNEGFEFVGTMPLDEALKSRFHFKIKMDILPTIQEQALLQAKCGLDAGQAQSLIDVVNSLRHNNQASIYISTRDIVNIADLMNFDLPLEIAVRTVLSDSGDVMESVRLGQHIRGSSVTTRGTEHYEYI